jgi:hypothetical protein
MPTPARKKGNSAENVMGSFISNLHVRGPSRDQVVAALQAFKAPLSYIGTASGWVDVFPKDQENDPLPLWQLLANLSHTLDCSGIAFTIYDSDIFWYALYDRGEAIDRYDSAPGYFEGKRKPAEGGVAERLQRYCLAGVTVEDLTALLHPKPQTGSRVDAFVDRLRRERPDVFAADPLLDAKIRRSYQELAERAGDDPGPPPYIFAEEVLSGLAAKLGIEPALALASHRYIEQNETSPGDLLLLDGASVRPANASRR